MSCPGVCDCLEILLIILLPPLGVAVSGSQKNIPAGRLCVDTFLNFLLWLFFYIPGLIHGLWVHSAYQNEVIDEEVNHMKHVSIPIQSQSVQVPVRKPLEA